MGGGPGQWSRERVRKAQSGRQRRCGGRRRRERAIRFVVADRDSAGTAGWRRRPQLRCMARRCVCDGARKRQPDAVGRVLENAGLSRGRCASRRWRPWPLAPRAVRISAFPTTTHTNPADPSPAGWATSFSTPRFSSASRRAPANTSGSSVTPLLEILSFAPAPDSSRVGWALPANVEWQSDGWRAYGSAGYFSRGAVFGSGALEIALSDAAWFTGSISQSVLPRARRSQRRAGPGAIADRRERRRGTLADRPTSRSSASWAGRCRSRTSTAPRSSSRPACRCPSTRVRPPRHDGRLKMRPLR